MDIAIALGILSGVANALQVGQGAQWAAALLRKGDATAQGIVHALPQHASADAIVSALQQGIGGNLEVRAGDNGGGHIVIEGASIASGDGTHRGGDLVIRSGDGGPWGNGGNLTIIGGTHRSGNGG